MMWKKHSIRNIKCSDKDRLGLPNGTHQLLVYANVKSEVYFLGDKTAKMMENISWWSVNSHLIVIYNIPVYFIVL
jgi:hypothetical protein